MKQRTASFFVASALLLISVIPAFSQTTIMTTATASIEHSSYEQLTQQEIAKDSRGAFLYTHSEVYRHRIECRVREALSRSVTTDGSSAKSETPIALEDTDADLSQDPSDQNETTVAVSRKDPHRIVAAANDVAMYHHGMPFYLSKDGGRSWQKSRLPALPFTKYKSGGDPVIVADEQGGFYYVFLMYDDGGCYSNIGVAHSNDGVDWAYCEPVLPIVQNKGFEDKETIGVDRDPSSPHYGYIYVSWVHFSLQISGPDTLDEMLFAWSSDHGQSWSSPIPFEDFACEFPQITFGKDGALLVAFSAPDTVRPSGGQHVLMVTRDNGVTITKHVIAPYADFPYAGSSGYTMLKGSRGFRCLPYVNIASDHRTGRIYAVFGTDEHAPGREYAGLYYTYSDDDGISWSPPIPIFANLIASETDRFDQWLTLDELTGVPYATFYSSEDDPGNTWCRYVRVELGEKGWGNRVNLDAGPFDPTVVGTEGGSPPFLGDYTACDAFGGTFAAAWTEHSAAGVDGEIYGYVASGTQFVRRPMPTTHNLTWKLPSENPVAQGTDLRFTLGSESNVDVELLDIRGTVVRQLVSGEQAQGDHKIHLDMSELAAGSYLCRATTDEEQVTLRLIKQ